MSWLFYAITSIFTESPCVFIDNYVSDVYFKDRHAASVKLFFGYAFVIISIILAIILQNDFQYFSLASIGFLVLSGCIHSAAYVPYYKALEIEESTTTSIFQQLAPILYLLANFFLYGETISVRQLFGFFVILCGPATIIMMTRKRSRHIRIKAILYVLLYIVGIVIGNIIFLQNQGIGSPNPYLAVVFFVFGKGLMNLILVYTNRKWLHRFRTVAKKDKRVFRPLTAILILNLLTDYFYHTALLVAPAAALASAVVDSSIPIVIFFAGIVLTVIWPKFGREKLTRRNVMAHLIATIFVVAGIILVK